MFCESWYVSASVAKILLFGVDSTFNIVNIHLRTKILVVVRLLVEPVVMCGENL